MNPENADDVTAGLRAVAAGAEPGSGDPNSPAWPIDGFAPKLKPPATGACTVFDDVTACAGGAALCAPNMNPDEVDPDAGSEKAGGGGCDVATAAGGAAAAAGFFANAAGGGGSERSVHCIRKGW